ncbi:glycoside hydrolase family 3 C-terminal domain-containing protein [Tanacetum coccineum]|uniref:Glycoside hydrolase family 3 C-terminal domain-containing protein n=1 Tax=Tanacetum coccineum TaxID=301880 RepID=A0ABQ5A5X7_9ASTR
MIAKIHKTRNFVLDALMARQRAKGCPDFVLSDFLLPDTCDNFNKDMYMIIEHLETLQMSKIAFKVVQENIKNIKFVVEDDWKQRLNNSWRQPISNETKVLVKELLISLAQKMFSDAAYFEKALKEEMLEDFSKGDFLCVILHSYDIDYFIDLVCQLTDQCKRFETDLSKRHKQKPDKDFAHLKQHYINLELALQHAKEKNVCENSWEKQRLTSGNNDKVWKNQNDSLIAELNWKTLEINDLKAQLQDKTIANAEIRERLNELKGKSVDTKFEKPPVVRQLTAKLKERYYYEEVIEIGNKNQWGYELLNRKDTLKPESLNPLQPDETKPEKNPDASLFLFTLVLAIVHMIRSKMSYLGIIVLLSILAVAVVADDVIYKDPKQPIAARLQDLLGRMTVEEKIGQMVQIERIAATPDIMRHYYIGSLLSGGGSVPNPKATVVDWINMVNEFQNGDPDLVKRIGSATASEVRATGIPYAFAPCIAVCRDPRWGRCYESYGEDTKLVQSMTEIILGLQGEIPKDSRLGVPYVAGKDKVAACAKHFVADGGTTHGIDENNTVVSEQDMLKIHMPPYYDAIIKGVSTVMVSYSSLNGKRMHANGDLITGYLKDKLGFKGFVISDWEGIDRITSPPHSNYTYSVQASILAGIDMVMVPNNYIEFINDLTLLVKSKIIPMERIDDAVSRILRVKFTMGLFENPLADFSLVNEVGSQAHREIAREAVRKSLVLLKNGKQVNDPILPLPKMGSKVLVAGSHADNLGYQCGGWTIGWQGFSGNGNTTGTTILNGIKSAVDPSTEITYMENPNVEAIKSNNFSYAIVVVGEHPYTEMFGDSSNLTIADPGPSIITNVCGQLKCVVVLISGRPVVIEPYMSVIDGLVAAWLPGTEGQGVADVLFGDHEFSGKLSRTWFRTVDQLPMNIGDQNYNPLFPFGYGLATKSAIERSISAGIAPRPFVLGILVTLLMSLKLSYGSFSKSTTQQPISKSPTSATTKLSSTTITITIQRTTTTNKKSSEERRRGKRMAKRSTVDLDADEEEEEQSRQVSRWTREEEILLCQCLVEVFENNEIGVDRNEESF